MKILGLEFSSEQRSAAVGEVINGELRPLGFLEEPGPRACTGIGLLDRLLKQSHVSIAEITAIAVGLGPGSYAGIRSAIALSQGWQLACGTPLLGISSADVIAKEAQIRGLTGEVTVVIDAQRSEVYYAPYSISPSEIIGRSLSIGTVDSLPENTILIGPAASGVHKINPTASALLKIAAGLSNYTPGELLEPIYLRETSFAKAATPRFPAA